MGGEFDFESLLRIFINESGMIVKMYIIGKMIFLFVICLNVVLKWIMIDIV